MRQTFLVILSFFTLAVAGQRANQEYRFTTEFSQYIFGNIPVSVEKIFSKRGTIGLTGAVRFSTKGSGSMGNGGFVSPIDQNPYDYTSQNTFNRFYNGYTLGLHFKYYFKDHRTFYFEPYFMYRYWWFNEKEVEFKPEGGGGFGWGYNYNGLRSELQRDFVFGINFGRTIKLKQTRKNKYVLDFEIGLGFIDRAYEFTTHRGTVNGEFLLDYTEEGFGRHPMINLGLSFGFER